MTKKQRWRFYCDHCQKGSGSGGHMARHERRCTANPKRACGVCEMAGNNQPDTPAFVAMLTAPGAYVVEDGCLDFRETFKRLREAADDCPACIFAALRQSKIMRLADEEHDTRILGVTLGPGFSGGGEWDFRTEMEAFYHYIQSEDVRNRGH